MAKKTWNYLYFIIQLIIAYTQQTNYSLFRYLKQEK